MEGTAFVAGFLFIFVNYHALSFGLQIYFYGLRADQRDNWKIQQNRTGKSGQIAFRCWVPVLIVCSDLVTRIKKRLGWSGTDEAQR
eukprot:3662720-Rhodomonas_salina.3